MVDTTFPIGTRLGKQYLKQYDTNNPDDHQSNPYKNLAAFVSVLEAPLDKNKFKVTRFDKSLRKRVAEDLSTPFKFNIVAKLVNISTCITMHELLCLSKENRDALHKDLADPKTFLTQIPLPTEEEYYWCHQVSSLINITFSPEDMLVKNPNHDRPLYYTGYIESIKIKRILIDLVRS